MAIEECDPLVPQLHFIQLLFVGLGRRQQRTEYYYYYTYAYFMRTPRSTAYSCEGILVLFVISYGSVLPTRQRCY